ncbi:MAG: diacylglycerol kinase family protein [Acidobacteriota bacterium]|nr:diacylglycerol kinase family protein [Acidobacteriota bacterium]
MASVSSSRLSRLAVIANPVAGPVKRRMTTDQITDLARNVCAAAGVECEVVFTGHRGHARGLAEAFVRDGWSLIVAWGGDGTINEVASALVRQSVVLGIVPSGSGNGLARELGISQRAEEALATVIRGRDRLIDVGKLGGRLFINLAGVGLGVSVAELFGRLTGRGLARYVYATLRQLLTYVPQRYRLAIGPETIETTAFLVELANGRQYGNGAIIAPGARLDNGFFDVVVIREMSLPRALLGLLRLFNGTVDSHPRVSIHVAPGITISSDRPMPFHVDGEVVPGETSLTGTVLASSLWVRVPAGTERT